MKNKLMSILSVMAFLAISCSSDENLVADKDSLLFENFKYNFPQLSNNISQNHIQGVLIENQLNKSANESFDGYTFPIIQENDVVGRYFGTSDELEAIYLDYSNYRQYIKVHDVNNPDTYDIIPMALNVKTGNYEPVVDLQNKTNGWLCGTLCALGTIAIASSDGPVPAMDVLAATYAVTCLADCATK